MVISEAVVSDVNWVTWYYKRFLIFSVLPYVNDMDKILERCQHLIQSNRISASMHHRTELNHKWVNFRKEILIAGLLYCISLLYFLATECRITLNESSRHIYVHMHLFLCICHIVPLFQNRLLFVLTHPFHAADQKVTSRNVTKCEFWWVSEAEWQ